MSGSSSRTQLHEYVSDQLATALDLLLREKHLYQVVRLTDANHEWAKKAHLEHARARITPQIGGGGTMAANVPLETFQGQYERYVKQTFFSISLNHGSGAGMPATNPVPYATPGSFDSYCAQCNLDQRTFLPDQAVRTTKIWSGDEVRQSWVLVFACAKCQARIEFFIVQQGRELKISGRFPLEFRPSPKEVPQAIQPFVSKATIAADTGYVLAGIFYLRVAIEQYLRSHPGVKALCLEPKTTGDALGEAYHRCIPQKLKDNAPSLKDLYSKLSQAIHEAKDDRPLFDKSTSDLIKHFKAREVLDVVDDVANPSSGKVEATSVIDPKVAEKRS